MGIALTAIKNGMPINKAAHTVKIAKGTLINRNHNKKVGRSEAFTKTEEAIFVDHILILGARWVSIEYHYYA